MKRILCLVLVCLIFSGIALGESLGKPTRPATDQAKSMEPQSDPPPAYMLPMKDLVLKQTRSAGVIKASILSGLVLSSIWLAIPLLSGPDKAVVGGAISLSSLIAWVASLVGFFDYLDASVAISQKTFLTEKNNAQQP